MNMAEKTSGKAFIKRLDNQSLTFVRISAWIGRRACEAAIQPEIDRRKLT